MTRDNTETRPTSTTAIRKRLKFEDSILWKRFSARRLELIDTLQLSSKKASDQDALLTLVAQTLCTEFGYSSDCAADFLLLVRAAVQSARRNRKRQFGTPKHKEKRTKVAPLNTPDSLFVSEVAHIKTENDEVYDMSYLRSRNFSPFDDSREAIEKVIQPPEPRLPVVLPPLNVTEVSKSHLAKNEARLRSSRDALLQLMRKSQLCLDTSKQQPNNFVLEIGHSALEAALALVFEKLFGDLSESSIKYLKEKVALLQFLAQFYRRLDGDSLSARALSDDTASLTLKVLVGCCIKDFGFDEVLFAFGEALFHSLVIDYPLVQSSLRPFCSEVEDDMVPPTRPGSKSVAIHFQSATLTFSYPMEGSAPPLLTEIMHNAGAAFKLSTSHTYGLCDQTTGDVITGDLELERLFKEQDKIELEVFSQLAGLMVEAAKVILPKITLPRPKRQVVSAHFQPLL